MNLYNTVEIYVCSFVCRNPMTDLRQILIGELGRTTGMFLAWFSFAFKLSGLILKN